MTLPHRRSRAKIEEKLAKQYCFAHCVSRHRNNNADEIREKVFVCLPEAVTAAVVARMAEFELPRSGEVPECPQGLVLSDSRGGGAFDV